MSLKTLFKRIACGYWGLLVIGLLLMTAQSSLPAVLSLFAWSRPLFWLGLGAIIVTLLAVFWPERK